MKDDSIARDAIRVVQSWGGVREALVSDRRPLMGGHATITLVGATDAMVDALFECAAQCEALWSRFLPDSDITRLNWSEGASTEVDPLTIRLIDAMTEGGILTGGDFDPTLLPLVIAAGYAASVVDATRITSLPASARGPARLDELSITGTRVRLPIGATLDPGGIGKGLTADLVCESAIALGARGVMAEIGGDIVVAGDAPDSVAWLLGVEDPFDSARHTTAIRLVRGALVTSSQRKRRFVTAGEERHHLIDPGTELSACSHIQTVTVIAATGAKAEALSKSGFVRPPADYLSWLPTVGAAGLLIDAAGRTHTSANWSRYA